MADATARGRFVWHELMTSDVKSAVGYYRKVVGWKTEVWQQGSDYLMWVASSGPMGGVAALPASDAAPYWLHYIATPDIQATVQDAEKLGGKVVVPITAIANGGRYAVLTDPQGGRFGVYESHTAPPSPGMPQLGEFSWHELLTTDYQAAFAFYQALFGWQKTEQLDMGDMGVYFMFGLGGQSMGGMYNKSPGMPNAVGWCCYAQVADAVKAAQVAARSGGKICNGPMQVPGGSWIAQLMDPQGAMHAVVSTAPVTQSAESMAKTAVGKVTRKKKQPRKKTVSKKPVSKKKKTVAKPKRTVTASKSARKKATGKKVRKSARPPVPKKKTGKKKVAPRKLKRTPKAKVVKRPATKRRGAAKRKK